MHPAPGPAYPPVDPPLDRRRRPRTVLLVAAAAVVALLAVVTTVAIVVVPSITDDPSTESIEAATAFGTEMNTYDSRRPEEFLDRMAPFLDPSYRGEFAALVTPLLDSLARVEQTSGRARVDAAEVVATGGDEARVQLSVSSRLTRLGQVAPTRLPQVWEVDLQESDDRWLVTAFSFSPGGPSVPRSPDDGPDDGPTADV